MTTKMRGIVSSMIFYEPVSIDEHSFILGKHFNEKFSDEMYAYYKPFIDKNRAIQLAKETWEYAVADSIPDGKWVGAGANIVDVETPNAQIDVKGLSTNSLSTITSEASILQNNKQENDNFASLFKNEDYTGLKEMFFDPFVEKTSKANNLYIFCSIREKKNKDVYYCLLRKVNKTNKNFISDMQMSAKRSVSMPMIDPEIGRTYLYIPKRRLEIRLNMKGMMKYCVKSHNYSGSEEA